MIVRTAFSILSDLAINLAAGCLGILVIASEVLKLDENLPFILLTNAALGIMFLILSYILKRYSDELRNVS